jgi:hypothetical protein
VVVSLHGWLTIASAAPSRIQCCPAVALVGLLSHLACHFWLDLSTAAQVAARCAGLTSLLPDCLMFCVNACSGVNRTSREHLAAALALDIPVFAVITKADQADPEQMAAAVHETRTLLATAADATTAARNGGRLIAGHTTDETTDVEPGVPAGLEAEFGVFATEDDEARTAARQLQVLRSTFHASCAAHGTITQRSLRIAHSGGRSLHLTHHAAARNPAASNCRTPSSFPPFCTSEWFLQGDRQASVAGFPF